MKKFSFFNRNKKVLNFLVPRIFLFHFKRFDNLQRKVKKFIEYPSEINLNKYQIKNLNKNEPFSYRLCSVLIHKGNSIYSGHYYCYIRVSDNNWYCFNDQTVYKVDESVVLNQNPYLLFYEKIMDLNKIKNINSNEESEENLFNIENKDLNSIKKTIKRTKSSPSPSKLTLEQPQKPKQIINNQMESNGLSRSLRLRSCKK